MVERFSVLASSLIGGISHQPPRVRLVNQVKDAVNASFSVVDGLSKRPGTEFVTSATGLSAGNSYRMHPINRDDDERYVVIHGDGNINVIHEDGTASAVTISADATTYINLNSPTVNQLRMVTITDSTFIVNTTVESGAGEDNVTFTITAGTRHDGYDDMTSKLPTASSFHEAVNDEASTTGAATATNELKGFFQYIGNTGFAKWDGAAVASGYRRPKRFWNNPVKNPMGFRVRIQRQDIPGLGLNYVTATQRLDSGGQNLFTNYTHTSGDEVNITGGSDPLPTGFHSISSKVDNDTLQLGTTYRDTSDDLQTTPLTNETNNTIVGITVPASATMDWTPKNATGGPGADLVDGPPNEKFGEENMNDIAELIEDKLNGTTSFEQVLVSWQPTVAGQKRGAGAFQIVTPHAGVNGGRAHGKVIGIHSTDTASDIDLSASGNPFEFAVGTTTDSTGTDAVTAATEDIDERWERVPASGQDEAFIDQTKMPVEMKRTASGPPATFSIDVVDWKARLSGDEVTNPLPKLFKNTAKIQDIFFHRNRFGLAGNEFFIFSEVGDLFDFWIKTAGTAVDSDPIDTTLGEEEITFIDFVEPFRKSLFVMTLAARQFELNTPETLTPDTAAFTGTTNYDTQRVRPTRQENRLYYAGIENNSGILYEYLFDDARASTVAEDVSAHAYNLPSTNIKTIEAAKTGNTVFVLGTDCDEIWVYRSHISGVTKDQSAWARWQFTEYTIHDIALLGTDLFMLVETEDALCDPKAVFTLEKIPATPSHHLIPTMCNEAKTLVSSELSFLLKEDGDELLSEDDGQLELED